MRLTPNPDIANLPLYNAGMNIERARRISGCETIAALASNENPYGCSPMVRAALASDTFDPSRYPDPHCSVLRGALSAALGQPGDCLAFGNGSEELIGAMSRAFLVAGQTALTVAPSFGLHEIEPLASGARVVKVPMSAGMDFDVAALERELRRGPALLFLSSPSNPVGSTLSIEDLLRLVGATSPGTLFVLDEAYFEYLDDPLVDGVACLRGVADAVDWVVLRTFSKAYGLAGFRIGYAICSSPDIRRLIDAAKPPFDVNTAAQVAATAALADQDWMRASVTRIRDERHRVAKTLRDLGLTVACSHANFLFFRTALSSDEVATRLLRDGVLVKPWREPGYANWVRVTIGSPDENDRFLQAFEALMRRSASATSPAGDPDPGAGSRGQGDVVSAALGTPGIKVPRNAARPPSSEGEG